MEAIHRLEKVFYEFKDRYYDTFTKYLPYLDLSFLCAYLSATTIDAVITLKYITKYHDEAHKFTSFMMETYGIREGLLRTQGIELLQLASLIGIAYVICEVWHLVKGKDINLEVRFGLIYIYMSIGIVKHLYGILSWL
ncbi:MAG: hypothetical protein JRJ12_15295 [Deltaproteobacteria bacterium]|nr:hypothetical protein [Deltaproteobacteria bacterium]MBW2072984.1 hypothetical protein [Deltaproteobacteria bacterium]